MAYAEYGFYKDTYKGSSIPSADFDRLATRSSSYIDSVVRCKIDPDSTPVKMATCAVAEAWRINEQGGDVTSQSVGPWSKSYNKAVKSDNDRLYEAVRLYLGAIASKVRWA